MNFIINRMDNLQLSDVSYEFIPEDIKKQMNINGMLVGSGGEFPLSEHNVMDILKAPQYGLQNSLGTLIYQAMLRKPMMLFLIPSEEEDFNMGEEELKERYGLMAIHLNNFAQSFSIGCWFIKDSCISATNIYCFNPFNGYISQNRRDMEVTLSNGTVSEVSFTSAEMEEALSRMYEVYRYLLPEESKMGRVKRTTSLGTDIWEVDKAVSTEANSFARALMILQSARRTGVLASKIDQYCSILECLYAIKKDHRKNIANITAALLGADAVEREEIRTAMKVLYGIRSDSSHGDNLKYLRENEIEDLSKLAEKLDDYVRRVFRKVIADPDLNYEPDSEKKVQVRAYFLNQAKAIYPEEY